MSKVINVSGDSMSPYLVSKDLVYVDEKRPEYGDLVLIKKQNNNELIVHRFLGEGKYKGDRIKDFDQMIWGELELCGRICGVENKNGYFSFKSNLIKYAHKIQGSLSETNIYKNRLRGKVSVLLLIIIGKSLRFLQGRV